MVCSGKSFVICSESIGMSGLMFLVLLFVYLFFFKSTALQVDTASFEENLLIKRFMCYCAKGSRMAFYRMKRVLIKWVKL